MSGKMHKLFFETTLKLHRCCNQRYSERMVPFMWNIEQWIKRSSDTQWI